MNEEDLDIKIRSLVAKAVADTPAPRPLPTAMEEAVLSPVPAGRRRGFVLAGLGVAASLVVVSLVWSARFDTQRVIPATSLAPETTSTTPVAAGWPVEIAVIVASERGVERVSAEGGEPVVTRVSGPTGMGGSPVKAYELGDGSLVVNYCCQEIGAPHIWRIQPDGTGIGIDEAGGALQDVSSDGAVLYVEGRFLVVSKGGVRTVVSTFAADAAVEPDFNLQSDWVFGTWDRRAADLPAVIVFRDGKPKEAGAVVGSVATATGDGLEEARLNDNGELWVTDGVGRVEILTVVSDEVVSLDMTWPFALVSYMDRPALLIDAITGARYEVPIANGVATLSMRSAVVEPVPEPTPVAMTDVRAVVTQRDAVLDDGVWVLGVDSFEQVLTDATGPAFLVGESIVYSPFAGGVSQRAADGTTSQLRATGFVQDAALFGGELYYLYTDRLFGEPVNLYLHGPGGETYIAIDDLQDTSHTSWHLGRDAIVGTGAYYAGMSANIFDHAGNRLDAEQEATRPANGDGNPAANDRAVYSMSPTGLWGALIGDTLTLRQWGNLDATETVVVPDWTKVARFDVAADRLLVTYTLDDGYTIGTNRMAMKTADGEWVWEDVPGTGWATLARVIDPGAPTPPTATPAAPDPWVALAGSWGVRLMEGPTPTVVETLPATRVLLLRDGSVVYRSPDAGGYPRMWDRQTGQSNILWAGTDWVAEPTLHDDMASGGNFLFTVGALLFEYDLERRRELAAAPTSRLSYASNGWVVGERVRYSIGETLPPDWIGGDGLWALDPRGELVASFVDGIVQVRRVSDGFVIYERAETDVDVTEIDVNDEWLSIAETPNDTPNADSTSRVVLVHLASGRSHMYEGAVSASLPFTGI